MSTTAWRKPTRRPDELIWQLRLYEKASALGQKNNDPNAALFTANFTRASDKLKQATAKPAEPAKKSQ